MGQAPPGTSYNTNSDGVPLVSGAGNFSEGRIRTDKFTTSPTRISRRGDILLSIRATIGTRVWADSEYCLGRGVAGLRPGPDIDSRYLWHWLSDVSPELARRSRGATFRQVDRNAITTLQVALRPLGEQRRIASILDKADSIRAKRRQVLAHLDDLTQSIFYDMFGALSPDHRLGEVARIQGGLQVTGRRSELDLQVPYMRVANVHRSKIDLTMVKTMGVTESELQRTQLAYGDLLFVEGHANIDEIGRVAVWRGGIDGCVHQNHLIRARINPEKLDSQFAECWFNSHAGAEHFRRAGHTTSGLHTISALTVRSAPVPIPDINVQRVFADRIRRVQSVVAKEMGCSETEEDLFMSLQSKAFKGEL
ncbi:restriction endonuclease subunit S [Acidipropionibacterium jensenii]|uniref:restriction endonuclease subunit S n=1 Tax=Acidipropionibacterium jensenii TaxID=1749 RepID=UPI00214B8977|nr:restriction endonuclease subunit S [Acidipropionibacterium jensenii]